VCGGGIGARRFRARFPVEIVWNRKDLRARGIAGTGALVLTGKRAGRAKPAGASEARGQSAGGIADTGVLVLTGKRAGHQPAVSPVRVFGERYGEASKRERSAYQQKKHNARREVNGGTRRGTVDFAPGVLRS
jgi:hypothetical protein